MKDNQTKFILVMTKNMKAVIEAKAEAEEISMSQWVRNAINEKASRSPWMEIQKRGESE